MSRILEARLRADARSAALSSARAIASRPALRRRSAVLASDASRLIPRLIVPPPPGNCQVAYGSSEIRGASSTGWSRCVFTERSHRLTATSRQHFLGSRSSAYSSDKAVLGGAYWSAALIEYRLLGPIEVGLNGDALDIGGRKQRALLAILVLSANVPVPRDVLIDRLWGEHPPVGAQHTLEVYVSRLRKALEPMADGPVVVTRPGAYLLHAPDDRIDIRRFEQLAAQGRSALAAAAPDRAAVDLRQALALWRGAPLADLSQELFVQTEIARLEELRANAVEDRIDADLALGRHADLVGELQALTEGHPFRERLYEQLMIALYRCGRQAEALSVYRTARRTFIEELGIEPSPGLRRVERAVLDHDASLQPTAPIVAAAMTSAGSRQPVSAASGRSVRFYAAIAI